MMNPQWLSVFNTESTPAPSYGVVEIVGVSDDGLQLTVQRPASDNLDAGRVLFLGPSGLPADSTGVATAILPALALHESSAGTLAVGDTLGTEANTYKLLKGNTGFVALEDTTSGQNTLMVSAAGLSSAPAGTLTVEEADGSPSVTSVTTLRVDSADGFVVSTPGAGIARLDLAAATASQAGIVSTGTQTFGGAKTFSSRLTLQTDLDLLSAGLASIAPVTPVPGTIYFGSGHRGGSGSGGSVLQGVGGTSGSAGSVWFTAGDGAGNQKRAAIFLGSQDAAVGTMEFRLYDATGTLYSTVLFDTNGINLSSGVYSVGAATGDSHTSVFGGVYTGGILTTAPSAYNLDNLTDVTAPTPSSGDVLQWNGSAWVNTPGSGLGSGGTVTSVALTAPSILSVAGSPVTTSGTLALTLATQVANRVFAGPSSGADATPTFRALVTDDLANDLVTYAKIQNISATSRILGRKTAAAGDTEECTLSEVLDFVGSAAQGDILYRGAATWTRLGAGTAGYVLQTGGAGANPSWVITREVLTAARTYYVRTDGSDSNTGLANTAGGAFLTVQKAVDVITGTLDTAGYAVTISVGSGTFTNAITLKHIVGGGTVSIVGAGLASTTFSVTSAVCITGDGCGGGWAVTDVKMQATTSGSCISMTQGYLTFANVAFGTTVNYHVFTGVGGFVKATGNYTINGNAQIHWFAQAGGTITVQSVTVTLSGTPAFSLEFARARDAGIVVCNGNTFSGSATGTRYYALGNGVIDTNGSASTYLPGNAAGSTASGGQYI